MCCLSNAALAVKRHDSTLFPLYYSLEPASDLSNTACWPSGELRTSSMVLLLPNRCQSSLNTPHKATDGPSHWEGHGRACIPKHFHHQRSKRIGMQITRCRTSQAVERPSEAKVRLRTVHISDDLYRYFAWCCEQRRLPTSVSPPIMV